jgi:cobalamin synthase
VVALGVCLLVKAAFLSALPAPIAWPGLVLTATLGRWATSFGLSAFPLASVGQDTEASPGLSDAGPSEFLVATVLAIVCAVVLPKRGLLILVAVALIGGLVAQALNRRLGGVTLPLCLALGELGEIAALACLALLNS